MTEAVVLPFPIRRPTDGGKDRITRKRELIGLAKQGGPIIEPDSLVMLRDDPSDSAIEMLQAGMLLPCDCA